MEYEAALMQIGPAVTNVVPARSAALVRPRPAVNAALGALAGLFVVPGVAFVRWVIAFRKDLSRLVKVEVTIQANPHQD
jgi:hypothetical protein